ncbi:MAG: sulfatase-like hydrolase/transferase, partial [Gammaproteobacteria bacterium]|nr:sulfatase-like hydrolase/transferase [Gammaproteobacteria bacterium]
MKRCNRLRFQWVICIALIIIITGCSESINDTDNKPNILFIAVDDLRPELGCYDQPQIKSPNIDKLAAGGVVFNRAYCQVPVCGASRASLLAGLRPTEKRFLNYKTSVDTDAPGARTLPQEFKENGYHT